MAFEKIDTEAVENESSSQRKDLTDVLRGSFTLIAKKSEFSDGRKIFLVFTMIVLWLFNTKGYHKISKASVYGTRQNKVNVA